MKKDLTNPLVIISFFLILATIIIFIYFYFIKPFTIKNIKVDVEINEKKELELLTTAYLNQSQNLNINKLFFDVKSNEYKVASEYYYLKNGKDVLDKYDDILDVAKIIFDNEKIEFDNFVINLDACGKEKYSTLEGFIYSDVCDLKKNIFEINDIYKINEFYYVEFYSSIADQTILKDDFKCDTGNYFSYSLSLTNLEGIEYQNSNYSKCVDNFNYGINNLKDIILEEIKKNDCKYKLIFRKEEQGFVFYNLKK